MSMPTRMMDIKVIQDAKSILKDDCAQEKFLINIEPKIKATSCPLDIYLVIDVSNSMGGEKIQTVKKALMYVSSKLGNNHQICIITFDSLANVISTLKPVDGSFKKIIDKMDAPGVATNISDGLKVAHSEITKNQTTKDRLPVVMLFTDGVPNKDMQKASEFQEYLKGLVVQYPIFTFAIGQDHDPNILRTISKHSNGGVYHFIKDASEIAAYMGGCLGGILSFVAADVTVTLKLQIGSRMSYQFSGVPSIYKSSKSDPTNGKITESITNLGCLSEGESWGPSLVVFLA
jgi:uncharacterized protein YegL